MKKLLAYALILVLALGCFPMSAFAEEEEIVLNFWGWGDEWQWYYDYYRETHPDSNIRINVVSKNWDDYQLALDTALASEGAAEDYPDLFCGEVAFAEKYINSEYSMPLANLGVDWDAKIEEVKPAPYTLGIGSDANGVLKGVAMQNTATMMYYRTDIAEEVLGTSDPYELREKYFKDLDTYIATAKQIEESHPDVDLVAGVEEMCYVYYSKFENTFVDDGVAYIDDNMLRYYADMKSMWDADMMHDLYNDPWHAAINDKVEGIRVLTITGAPWRMNTAIRKDMVETEGKWHATFCPEPSFWGGTWLMVGKDTDPAKYEAIAEYLNFWVFDTTETGMGAYLSKEGDCPSSLVGLDFHAENIGPADFAGGQNLLAFYKEVLAEFDVDHPAVKNWNRYSRPAMDYMIKVCRAYINGEVGSLEECVEYYYELVSAGIDCELEEGWEDKVAAFEEAYTF